jgi:hypothetical protein
MLTEHNPYGYLPLTDLMRIRRNLLSALEKETNVSESVEIVRHLKWVLDQILLKQTPAWVPILGRAPTTYYFD